MNNLDVKNEEKELEINIPGMIVAVLKRLWIVILVAIVCGAGAFTYYKNTYVPVYSTRVGLYIIGDKEAPATGTAVQIATNIAKDYELLIKDPIVLDKVSAAVKEKGIAVDIRKLASRISVESPENTRILWINVVWAETDSVAAREDIVQIANAVRDAAYDEIPKITNVPASKISDAESATLASSGILKKTVILAFLGACFASFVIALCYIISDKLSTKKDIESRLGITVLGVIPNFMRSKKLADDKISE